MALPSLKTRLAKLEAAQVVDTGPKRIFMCTMRQGHEEQDYHTAFSRLGISPDNDDLVLCLVGVPVASHDDDFVPVAELSKGRREAA